jgi:uncharacterized membrane protein
MWVGNSFMVVTSLGLMAHHLFGCWHGDRRLKDKYGDAFEEVRQVWCTQVCLYKVVYKGSKQLQIYILIGE